MINKMKPLHSTLAMMILAGWTLGLCTSTGHAQSQAQNPSIAIDGDHVDDPDRYPLGTLPVWDDGLCEISYYRTTTIIYNEPRSYTRVHLLNRQWMEPHRNVKTDLIASDSIPVLKLNIVEEIPIENYNYRYQTTVYVRRDNLQPFKMVTSSQEWCGTTYKHLQWSKLGVSIQSFSYQNMEGVKSWNIFEKVVPYESLSVIARNIAATGVPTTLNVFLPMCGSKEIKPQLKKAILKPGPEHSVTIDAGKFMARRVDMSWDGPPTGFLVESKPPYRLLRFRNGSTRGELQHVERRAYWDRKSKSSFYPVNQAP